MGPSDTAGVHKIFLDAANDDFEPGEEQRVLAVWNRISVNYGQQETLSPEDRMVLSNSSKLSVYLKDIGAESLEWLKLSAQYVDVGHDSPNLIEQLDRLADASPKEVGEVYLAMFDNDVFPRYDFAHVESSVEKLYLAVRGRVHRRHLAGPDFGGVRGCLCS